MTRPFVAVSALLCWLAVSLPAAAKGPISVHVLNTAIGKPASGVEVKLERQAGKRWEELGQGRTNDNGRLESLLPAGKRLEPGVYRLVFETGAYFKGRKEKTLFPLVEVTFEVEKADEHYHIPLLLSPFSYSTYRGS